MLAPNSEPGHADAMRNFADAWSKIKSSAVQRGFAAAMYWERLPTAVFNDSRIVVTLTRSVVDGEVMYALLSNDPPPSLKRTTPAEKAARRPLGESKAPIHGDSLSSRSTAAAPPAVVNANARRVVAECG